MHKLEGLLKLKDSTLAFQDIYAFGVDVLT